MKKVILSVGLLLGIWHQSAAQIATPKSDSYDSYTKRKLKVEEINLVSNYYEQDGNNSAVTGGIGTEKLNNIGNSLDLKLSFIDRRRRLHTITGDFNIDHYTSASSDNIDPRTISGASRSDTHIYPSLSWSVKNEATHTTKGLSLSYSTEWDYESYGVNFNFSKSSRNNNREVSVKGGVFLDNWWVILPIEFRELVPTTTTTTVNTVTSASGGGRRPSRGQTQVTTVSAASSNYSTKPRNSYNLALSLSQVINKNLQVLLVVEPSYQQGLLSTPYHRVYFSNGVEAVERLPGSRLKLPIGIRASYFIGDRYIVRGFYRFYTDDWGMTANTFNLEGSVKITPFTSISPFYRFHQQSAVRYFRPYGKQAANAAYYTSDYDISDFNSHFVGLGIRLAPPNGILGIKFWNNLEVRYGHYLRTTGMVGNSITLAMKMK